MKKRFLLLVSVLSVCLLTSCQVNWFGETRDVAWYWIAIPVAVICLLGYWILMRMVFVCPVCKTEFSPKWYQLSVTVHLNRSRLVRCPHCKRMGFCKRK